MASEKREGEKKRGEYAEGIIKTAVPSLFGLLAGVISFALKTNPSSGDGLLIAILLVMVQKFFYPILHINMEGAKDWIYISFMTILCWFLTFTLFLNV
ncbi:MAG: EMC6-like membrane protein [Candidatus Methanospirareceae archaeon]